MKLSLKPFSKGLRSLEAEPQVARRNGRNPLLIPGVRPGNQSKHTKKERPTGWLVFPMSALCARSIARLRTRFFIIFWLIFAKRKSKRGFRVLRDTAQGSALRTRKPLKRFDPNFISPAGGTTLNLFPHLSPRPACGTKSFIFPIQKDFTIQQLTNTSIAV